MSHLSEDGQRQFLLFAGLFQAELGRHTDVIRQGPRMLPVDYRIYLLIVYLERAQVRP